jgi:hypothetical protein
MYTYPTAGTYTASLQVTDNHGATGRATVTITAGNRAPTATITSPAAGARWKVGDTITFGGSASDPDEGPLPPSALSWSLVLFHCPSNCHTHPLQSYPGVAGGSFVTPDHEYPSYLELRLTATDSGELTDTKTVRLDPRTVNLTLSSNPTGRTLALNGRSAVAPFTRTVIEGSNNSIAAPSPQVAGSRTWTWLRWSDGGAPTHNLVASATGTRTATFRCRASLQHDDSASGREPHALDVHPWRAREQPAGRLAGQPKGRITVFTGVSGSGKSSIVFDTVAPESQRLLTCRPSSRPP